MTLTAVQKALLCQSGDTYSSSEGLVSVRWHLQQFRRPCCAGFATLALTNPIWVTKTRLCLQYEDGSGGTGKRYRGMIDALVRIFREEGVRGLYKVGAFCALSFTLYRWNPHLIKTELWGLDHSEHVTFRETSVAKNRGEKGKFYMERGIWITWSKIGYNIQLSQSYHLHAESILLQNVAVTMSKCYVVREVTWQTVHKQSVLQQFKVINTLFFSLHFFVFVLCSCFKCKHAFLILSYKMLWHGVHAGCKCAFLVSY